MNKLAAGTCSCFRARISLFKFEFGEFRAGISLFKFEFNEFRARIEDFYKNAISSNCLKGIVDNSICQGYP